MALKTKKGSIIPEGAVKLDKNEALEFQKNFIKNWPSELEVCSLKFASQLNVLSTAVCSAITFNYFKNVFQVATKFAVIPLLPSVIIPSSVSLLLTDKLITDKNLLMVMSCPLCTQLKFTFFQMYNSVVSPIILSFLFCHNLGEGSYAVLSPNSPFKSQNFWKSSMKLLKKGYLRFQVITLFQLGFSFILPYAQTKQLSNIMNKCEKNNYDE